MNTISKIQPKILFTDLDGTLLTSEKTISAATRDFLTRWTDQGHKLALSSGRATDSIRDVQKELSLFLPGMYLIGYNGCEIYDCDAGQILSRTALTMEQTALVMDTAKEMGIHCHTYTDTHIVTPALNEQLTYYQRVIHTPVIHTEHVLEALDQPPCKCIAIELNDHERMEAFRIRLESLAGGALSILYSNPFYLEIFSSQAGKGQALRQLCRLLSIPINDSLSAGDEINDISMIQAAGTGIAMKNAREEVKKAADLVTRYDNDHDGLIDALQNLL